jgi:hypothetical protein
MTSLSGSAAKHARRSTMSTAPPDFEPLRILSLGAGVQSTTLALMSAYGEVEKIDFCLFADTMWEPAPVYNHLKWLVQELSRNGIPTHTVTAGSIKDKRFASRMPVFIDSGGPVEGRLRKACTHRLKIDPLEKKIKELRGDRTVEHWFGISLDEIVRMRMSQDDWRYFHYPLVDMRMTRDDCHVWLGKHSIDAPRSACVCCPNRSDKEWRWLRDNSPEDWEELLEFDNEMVRHGLGTKCPAYIHRSIKPMEHVDLSTLACLGQASLWDNECSGICGV